MKDREDKQFDEFLNSLKAEEASPNEKFKAKLKTQMIREFNKGNNSGYSIADWYLNFLSLILVVISISLVAYFGVLYNTGTGTQNGSTVVLSDSEKVRILENYSKNNPETLTKRRPTQVLSNPVDQKSSNFFSVVKTETFSSQYFRCTGSFLISNRSVREETHYDNGETSVKQVISNGVGELISEKVVTYVGRVTTQKEYVGGEYVALSFSDEEPRSELNSPASISQVSRNGKDYYEIEYRTFFDCKGVQEQLITLQYADINTYKVELEEVYLGSKSQDNLYSISSIQSSERNINDSEKRNIFKLDTNAEELVVNNTDLANSLLDILVPADSFIQPINGRTDLKTVNVIDRDFYPRGNWGDELFEYNVSLLENPTLKYDIQLSPFEYSTITISGEQDLVPNNTIDSSVIVNGTRISSVLYTNGPLSGTIGNNQVVYFEYNGVFYKIETTDVSEFSELENFNR